MTCCVPFILHQLLVALRIELSAIRLSAGYGPTSPRLPSSVHLLPHDSSTRQWKGSQLGRRTYSATVVPSVIGASKVTHQPCSAIALHCLGSSYGSRTHLSALKERYPEPIDERAVFCVRFLIRAVGREALESSSAVLQTAAKPSQLPTRGESLPPQKKARCRS